MRTSGEQTGRVDFSGTRVSSKVGKFRTSSPEAFCQRYGRSFAGAIAQKALNSRPFGCKTRCPKEIPRNLSRSFRRFCGLRLDCENAPDPASRLQLQQMTDCLVRRRRSSETIGAPRRRPTIKCEPDDRRPGIAVAVKRPKPRLTVLSRRGAGQYSMFVSDWVREYQ